MIHLSPSDIEEMPGPSPDILRDWRRRGLLRGIGHIVLPDGSITSDTEIARAAGVNRPAWLYALGDAVRLVIARNLGALTNDIETQLTIANLATPSVVEFAMKSSAIPALVDRRYLVVWRDDTDRFAALRFDDLNNLANYEITHAIIIDMHREAARLPAKLLRLLASKFAPAEDR
jgi:hypothetical protein